MANNRLPFGLCKQYHIDLPENATPKDAWEALKKNGIEYFEQEESEILNPQDFIDDPDPADAKHHTSKKTVLLPKAEYEKVFSEISTHYSPTMKEEKPIIFRSGNFAYHVEIYDFGDYRIVGKRRLN